MILKRCSFFLNIVKTKYKYICISKIEISHFN